MHSVHTILILMIVVALQIEVLPLSWINHSDHGFTLFLVALVAVQHLFTILARIELVSIYTIIYPPIKTDTDVSCDFF